MRPDWTRDGALCRVCADQQGLVRQWTVHCTLVFFRLEIWWPIPMNDGSVSNRNPLHVAQWT